MTKGGLVVKRPLWVQLGGWTAGDTGRQLGGWWGPDGENGLTWDICLE